MKENEINILMSLIKKKGINVDGAISEQVLGGGSSLMNDNLNEIKYEEEKKMPDLNESVITNKNEINQRPTYKKKDKIQVSDEILMNKEKAFDFYKTN